MKVDAGSADSSVRHERMPPGWHITTGPPAIVYDPANQARGRFAIEAEAFLFPGQGNDGYGVFLGGSSLASDNASWVAFLVTRDGSATVQRHRAGSTSELVPLMKTTAVKPYPGEGTAHNIIRVLVQGDSVTFSANGQRIVALHRETLALEGTFGFRIGRDVNVHLSNLDLIARLAPYPERR